MLLCLPEKCICFPANILRHFCFYLYGLNMVAVDEFLSPVLKARAQRGSPEHSLEILRRHLPCVPHTTSIF